MSDANTAVFNRLQKALENYADVCQHKLPAEIISAKGRQFIFGMTAAGSKDGASTAFEGVYAFLKTRAPKKGAIRKYLYAGFEVGEGVRISRGSEHKANSLIPEGGSAIFKKSTRKGVATLSPAFVNAKGKHIKGTKGAIAKGAQKLSSTFYNRGQLQKGDVLLNRQAYAVYLEIKKREASRGYSASAYLGIFARKFLNSISLKKNFSRSGSIKNKAGKSIGTFQVATTKDGAYIAFVNKTQAADTAGVRLAINKALNAISADTERYIERKLAEMQRDILNK